MSASAAACFTDVSLINSGQRQRSDHRQIRKIRLKIDRHYDKQGQFTVGFSLCMGIAKVCKNTETDWPHSLVLN